MSERAPSAKEMYGEHKEHAEAVEVLGDLATGVHHTDEYNISLPQKSVPHLEAATISAQKALNKHAAKAGIQVTKNLDTFVNQAKVDMAVDATNEHRNNLADEASYARTRENYPDLHADAVARKDAYQERHADFLGPKNQAA